MIILHFARINSESIGGPHVCIPKYLRSLNSSGIQAALIICKKNNTYNEIENFFVFHVRDFKVSSIWDSLPYPFNEPDLLHFHEIYIPLHVKIAKKAFKKGIPYIITPHGSLRKKAQEYKRVKKLLGNVLFFNQMVKHSAAIHCLSFDEEKEVKLWGRPTFVVPNGVKIPEKIVNHVNRDHINLLFLGRLNVDHKGLDLLLEGLYLAKKRQEGKKLCLTIAGPDHKGGLKKLRKVAQKMNIMDSVTFTGPVIGHEKEKLFLNTDVYIQTSRTEGHPMSVLEALSYGLPCLLTPGTTMADEVEKSGAGWRVDGTANSIAEGLCNVIKNTSDLPRMSYNARTLAETKYNWNSIAKQMINYYEKIISGKFLYL